MGKLPLFENMDNSVKCLLPGDSLAGWPPAGPPPQWVLSPQLPRKLVDIPELKGDPSQPSHKDCSVSTAPAKLLLLPRRVASESVIADQIQPEGLAAWHAAVSTASLLAPSQWLPSEDKVFSAFSQEEMPGRVINASRQMSRVSPPSSPRLTGPSGALQWFLSLNLIVLIPAEIWGLGDSSVDKNTVVHA